MTLYFCSGCGQKIEGEPLEVVRPCMLMMCDHADLEKCSKSICYSHDTEGCFEAADAATEKMRSVTRI